MHESIEHNYSTEEKVKVLCEEKLVDLPLNDSGQTRTIRFKALGSLWIISFNNDYDMNSIAEEFLAVLQIILAEISLSKYDFHLVKSSIVIELEVVEKPMPPKQLPSFNEYKWKVFVHYSDDSDSRGVYDQIVKIINSLLNILNEVSLLKDAEFRDLFFGFFKENSLSSKTLPTNSYQRMYRQIVSIDNFNSLYRQHFNPVSLDFNLPKDNIAMQWRNELSSKYNHQNALGFINGRFKNSYKCIYLTIEKLRQSKDFHVFINTLRNEGFFDWQIVLGIFNFIVNHKASMELKNSKIGFTSEEEYFNALSVAIQKYINMDEKDCYVEFPLEAFKNQDFNIQLRNYPINVLRSFGLENKSRFPNIEAIKNFLEVRFNMKNDNSDLQNPLKDISNN